MNINGFIYKPILSTIDYWSS